MKCTGQTYSLEGTEVCQTCSFPYMVRGEDNWCTPLWFVLSVLSFLLVVVVFLAIFGRLRLECLKRRIAALIAAKSWQELYNTNTSLKESGSMLKLFRLADSLKCHEEQIFHSFYFTQE